MKVSTEKSVFAFCFGLMMPAFNQVKIRNSSFNLNLALVTLVNPTIEQECWKEILTFLLPRVTSSHLTEKLCFSSDSPERF